MASTSSPSTSSSSPPQPSLIPAALCSLAIYNPSLGPTDETIHDQIIFYTSRERATPNSKLRQIGLAQGVVEFAKVFSKTENLSSVETEKSRIVLHEVEHNWWILAYIDLTRISTGQPGEWEYSTREVSPPQLLLSQLTSAYHQFLFLYGTFSTAFASLGRETFCKKVEKFWTKWAWRWNVTLSGNPAAEIWGGVKIAQPRVDQSLHDVLEAFVEQEQQSGLLDMVVARYGKEDNEELVAGKESTLEPPRALSGLSNLLWPSSQSTSRTQSSKRQLPTQETYPREITPEDGCIYLGKGNLEASSLRDISKWIANFYTFNDDGSSSHNKRRKTKRPRQSRNPSSSSLLRELTSTREEAASRPQAQSPTAEPFPRPSPRANLDSTPLTSPRSPTTESARIPRPPNPDGTPRVPRPPNVDGTPRIPRPPNPDGTPRIPRPPNVDGTPRIPRPPNPDGTPRVPRPPNPDGTPRVPRPPNVDGTPRVPRPPNVDGTPRVPRPPNPDGTPRVPRLPNLDGSPRLIPRPIRPHEGSGSPESSPPMENAQLPPNLMARPRPRSLIAQHRDPSYRDPSYRDPSYRDPSETRERIISTPSSKKQITSPPASGGSSRVLNYLTLGWAGGPSRDKPPSPPANTEQAQTSEPPVSDGEERKKKIPQVRFAIGYIGDLDEDDYNLEPGEALNTETSNIENKDSQWKITERAVWLNTKDPSRHLLDYSPTTSSQISPQDAVMMMMEPEAMEGVVTNSTSTTEVTTLRRSSTGRTIRVNPKLTEFRLVVYVNPPFIFALFFHPTTPHLAQPSYYRSLHLRLGPLRGPLLGQDSDGKSEPPPVVTKPGVFDLLFDPLTLFLTYSVPNIPPYPFMSDSATQNLMSRSDAINIHNQILNIYGDNDKEKERKSRTTRGWWVAWSRLTGGKEAVLVWKGGEGGKDGEISGDTADDSSAGGGLFDTKKYFDALLRGRVV